MTSLTSFRFRFRVQCTKIRWKVIAVGNWVNGYAFSPVRRYRCCGHTTPHHNPGCRNGLTAPLSEWLHLGSTTDGGAFFTAPPATKPPMDHLPPVCGYTAGPTFAGPDATAQPTEQWPAIRRETWDCGYCRPDGSAMVPHMHMDPRQIPTTLMEPSNEAAQPPDVIWQSPVTGIYRRPGQPPVKYAVVDGELKFTPLDEPDDAA